jgi:SSS family transporter
MPIPAFDIAVIIGYLVLCVTIGLKMGGKPTDANAYFTSRGTIPWWAVSFSIVATETSMLTVISIPAVAYLGSLVFLQLVVGYIIGRFIIAWLILPTYFQTEHFTAYSFFEQRFGNRFKQSISATFLVTRILADGVRLFAAAIPLKVITGLDYPTSIAIIAILTLAYTYYGGLKSVIWIDVLQLAVYLTGGFLIVYFAGTMAPDVSITSLIDLGKLTVIQLPTSVSDIFFSTYNVIGAVIGGIFFTAASHGTDHLIVQRLLACGRLNLARKALITSGFLVLFQFLLFLSAGLALYSFYGGASIDSLGLSNPDEISLKFIKEVMPAGFSGLIIAGLFAAAMSTLSSSLAALSSTTLYDLIPSFSKRSDAMRISRILMVIYCLIFVSFGIFFSDTDNPVIELGLGIAGFTYGGLLGAFIVGKFTNVSKTAAFAGLIGCISLMALIIVFTTIAWPWYTLIGIVIFYCVSTLTNLFTSNPKARN